MSATHSQLIQIQHTLHIIQNYKGFRQCFILQRYSVTKLTKIKTGFGKSSESVQCAMLKACDACADMGQL